MFGTILIIIITLMHLYVFWRACSVPIVKRYVPRRYIIGMGVVLWVGVYLGFTSGHGGTGFLARAFELFGMNWMAVVFLITISLLPIDFITGFGFLFTRRAPSLRGLGLFAGILLSMIALVQGLRPPVVQNHDVTIDGLPGELDGAVIIALSDLHLGSLLGWRWLEKRVTQAQAQEPDIVVLLGDIFEGHGRPQEELLTVLRRISAPRGVYAVLGNHEYHGRNNTSTSLMKDAGFQVLRNSWSEVLPGFVVAGVDNLPSNISSGQGDDLLSKTLEGRPPGVTILLSHKPLLADRAAHAGVGLMLCGHTHGGQIWPFGYLVQQQYPLLAGKYIVDGMSVIVCRGTGTWGPRMRLWRPGEILRITLHGY